MSSQVEEAAASLEKATLESAAPSTPSAEPTSSNASGWGLLEFNEARRAAAKKDFETDGKERLALKTVHKLLFNDTERAEYGFDTFDAVCAPPCSCLDHVRNQPASSLVAGCAGHLPRLLRRHGLDRRREVPGRELVTPPFCHSNLCARCRRWHSGILRRGSRPRKRCLTARRPRAPARGGTTRTNVGIPNV